MSAAKSGKKAVNLSISADLLLAARRNEINLTAMLESAVVQRLGEMSRLQWLQENGDAIRAYNRDVEDHGAFSERLRTF
jgi:antitoxin CcdA